ncbi:MAG TPA: glycine--tRNA ligase subunit beta, partial [Elusimicrobiota bacterium]|nr:glycine--tRNA ligase subunit beta [Elusimicrobiota bacterium]
VQEIVGPPARLWKDATGAFTPQAAGFARSQGLKPEELIAAQTPKGECLVARKTLPGEPASKVLARVFPALVAALEFPKGLWWEESKFHFARPIRNLMALYGKGPVRFSLAGIRSGNKVRGLACLGYKPVPIPDGSRYARALRDRCVLVDVAERREALVAALDQAAKRSSGTVDKDPALLERVVCLTEHPVAVLCRFDPAYLDLPAALLSTVLKTQMNFFPVVGRDGRLTADFIGVRDGVSEGQKEVQEGYERVLAARLSDARFFVARDRETTLEAKAAKLAGVGFQKGLGTMADKAERVRRLAGRIAEELLQDQDVDSQAVDAIARLAYADLVTGVVGEFPELQGAMGAFYARADGLDEKVALGLEEFYQPAAAKAPLPTHAEGIVAALAGKLDTIAAMLGAGFKPSGSEDPFGLRRLGNGVARILLERQLTLPVGTLIETAVSLVLERGAASPFDAAAAGREVSEFLWQRAESLFLEKGFKADEIRSVKDGALGDLARAFRRLCAVHALRPDPDFAAIAQAFKRASNILRQASWNDSSHGVDQALLAEDAERALFDTLCRIKGEVAQKVSDGDFEDGLRTLVRLKPEVDVFFEKVLVNAPDASVRSNRLALLDHLVRLFRSVADISHIQN